MRSSWRRPRVPIVAYQVENESKLGISFATNMKEKHRRLVLVAHWKYNACREILSIDIHRYRGETLLRRFWVAHESEVNDSWSNQSLEWSHATRPDRRRLCTERNVARANHLAESKKVSSGVVFVRLLCIKTLERQEAYVSSTSEPTLVFCQNVVQKVPRERERGVFKFENVLHLEY